MDSFRGIRGLKLDPSKNESLSVTALPASLLDSMLPGYSLVSRLIHDTLGIDITSIVSVAILLAATATGLAFLGRHFVKNFMYFFSSSITIDSHDFLFDQVLAWAAANKSIQQVRSLRGHSAVEAVDADDPSTFVDLKIEHEFNDDDAIFNFKEWAFKAPPRYEPYSSSGPFWHKSSVTGKSNLFTITRDREQTRGGWMGMGIVEREKLTIKVLGMSTKPLKNLIVETRDVFFERQTGMTVIKRPAPKEYRSRGRSAWNKVAIRPSRPMTTVVLDAKQKATVLRDMNEFLHPKMPKWYANRGIPYRRGYLFHGPPGTGKTSLSFALAGVFGLDIYCLSLSEVTLTEEDLIMLFNSLPKRCVVLLEDIDNAGVLRKTDENADCDEADGAAQKEREKHPKKRDKQTPENKAESEGAGSNPPEVLAVEKIATAIASSISKAIETAFKTSQRDSRRTERGNPQERPPSESKSSQTGITMSGLLNAIDGVASQEGRVLVMTTNFPERLDDALIRPGRVDLKVHFDLAGRREMQELFQRMYDIDDEERKAIRRGGIVKKISEIIPQSEQPRTRDEETVKSGIDAVTECKTALLTPPGTPTNSKEASPPNGSTNVLNAAASARLTTLRPLDPVALSNQGIDIRKLAEIFASRLPDGVFSPAEIQGFLLTHKKDPISAVLEVDAWRDQEIARKEKGKNVVEQKDGEENKAYSSGNDEKVIDGG